VTRSSRHSGSASPRRRWPLVATVVAVLVVGVTTVAFASGPVLRPSSDDVAAPGASAPAAPAPVPPTTSAPAPAAPTAPATAAAPPVTPTAAPAPRAARSKPRHANVPRTTRVSVFGDSVLLGAKPSLKAKLPRADVDATVARQSARTFAAVRAALRTGDLADLVVIHVGTNGSVERRALDGLVADLGARRVVLVTAHVPRSWQDVNNQLIAGVADDHARVRVADWHGLAERNPRWFGDDGVHPTPSGNAALAGLIRSSLG
jgi:hypothetical protein